MKKLIAVTFLTLISVAGANAGVLRAGAKVVKFSAKHGAHAVKDVAKVAFKVAY